AFQCALIQAQKAVEHLQSYEMPRDAGGRQAFVPQICEIMTEVADAGPEIIGHIAPTDPFGKSVQIPSISQQRIARQAALGLEIVPKGINVIDKGSVLTSGVGQHGAGLVLLWQAGVSSHRPARLRFFRQFSALNRSRCNTGRMRSTARARWLSACLTRGLSSPNV